MPTKVEPDSNLITTKYLKNSHNLMAQGIWGKEWQITPLVCMVNNADTTLCAWFEQSEIDFPFNI